MANIGCHGDGSLGHQHTRVRCAMLLEAYAWDQEQACGGNARDGRYLNAVALRDVATALRAEMSDDAWEENAACEMLEECAPLNGAAWGWRDGDFGLWPLDEVD